MSGFWDKALGVVNEGVETKMLMNRLEPVLGLSRNVARREVKTLHASADVTGRARLVRVLDYFAKTCDDRDEADLAAELAEYAESLGS
jgi:hypothetical protein